jgi:hypothetical protein
MVLLGYPAIRPWKERVDRLIENRKSKEKNR